MEQKRSKFNAKDTGLYALYVGLNICPIIITLTLAITNMKAKLIIAARREYDSLLPV
jgi:hypothetical protein